MPKDAESLRAVVSALLKVPRSQEDLGRISEFLCEVKCCYDYSAALLNRLCHCVQAKMCVAGEEICRQGEVTPGLLIVLEGLVAVSVRKHGSQTYVARLGPLATIGEAAVSRELLSNSTLTALQPTTLCQLSRTDYLSALHSQTHQDQTSRASFLHSTALFHKLSKQGVFKLAGYFQEYRLKRSECFYREGDIPLAVFLIVSGEVEFLKKHVVSSSSEPYFHALPCLRGLSSLSMKGSGELFGQEEVLGGGPRHYTACCASVQCVVLGISKTHFLAKVQNGDVLESINSLRKAEREWIGSRLEQLKTTEGLRQSFNARSSTPSPTIVLFKPSPAKTKHKNDTKPVPYGIFPTEVPISIVEKSISYSSLPTKDLPKGQLKSPLLRPTISTRRSHRRSESVRAERVPNSLDSPVLKEILRPIRREHTKKKLSDYSQ